MKKNSLLVLFGLIIALYVVDTNAQTNANRKLSNLQATAINQSLLPSATNSFNLGSSGKMWKNAYFTGRIGIGQPSPLALIDIVNPTSSTAINIVNTATNGLWNTGIEVSSIVAHGIGTGISAFGGGQGLSAHGVGGNSPDGVWGVDGVASGSENAGRRYGVYGSAWGGQWNYGVVGYGSDGTNNYGVYGYAGSGAFSAAGYFAGDIYATNYLYTSDRKMKTAISPLQNPLQQLMKLKPASFQFKTTDYPQMGLPRNKQMGLIADEVKQVFPELVKEQVQPPVYGKDKKEILKPEVKFDAVNYIGLIPVLIASIQEQQKTITGLSTQNEDLQKQINELKAMAIANSTSSSSSQPLTKVMLTDAKLEQNNPNPFVNTTSIRYNIPAATNNAQLMITDNSGKAVKQITLHAGAGVVNIDASAFSSGTYHYTLVVNGKLIESKKMVVTH